jgi:hypothetical protein
MSAPKLAFFLGITLVALLTLTKGVPRHQNTATATTAPAIFQQMMPVTKAQRYDVTLKSTTQ